jgi:hypothetical protein
MDPKSMPLSGYSPQRSRQVARNIAKNMEKHGLPRISEVLQVGATDRAAKVERLCRWLEIQANTQPLILARSSTSGKWTERLVQLQTRDGLRYQLFRVQPIIGEKSSSAQTNKTVDWGKGGSLSGVHITLQDLYDLYGLSAMAKAGFHGVLKPELSSKLEYRLLRCTRIKAVYDVQLATIVGIGKISDFGINRAFVQIGVKPEYTDRNKSLSSVILEVLSLEEQRLVQLQGTSTSGPFIW